MSLPERNEWDNQPDGRMRVVVCIILVMLIVFGTLTCVARYNVIRQADIDRQKEINSRAGSDPLGGGS